MLDRLAQPKIGRVGQGSHQLSQPDAAHFRPCLHVRTLRAGAATRASVTWAEEEVIAGALYALFAGAGGAYAENDAPDPGSCHREYRGCSAGSGFFAFGPVPA